MDDSSQFDPEDCDYACCVMIVVLVAGFITLTYFVIGLL